jgi:hypothetical protein
MSTELAIACAESTAVTVLLARSGCGLQAITQWLSKHLLATRDLFSRYLIAPVTLCAYADLQPRVAKPVSRPLCNARSSQDFPAELCPI